MAGAWFKALPTTTILAAEVDRDASWVIEQLIALRPEALTNEITISASEGEIHVSGYETAEGCGPSKIAFDCLPHQVRDRRGLWSLQEVLVASRMASRMASLMASDCLPHQVRNGRGLRPLQDHHHHRHRRG